MDKQYLNIVLLGNPVTKKNSGIIAKTKQGRPFILPSRAYQNYEKEALAMLAYVKKHKIDYPVNVSCKYYMQTRRKVDLCNLLEATMDILVKAEILEDDNSSIVAGHNGSGVFYDKEKPRVEVEITPLEVSENAI